jgi:hypothetical protein
MRQAEVSDTPEQMRERREALARTEQAQASLLRAQQQATPTISAMTTAPTPAMIT